MGPLILFRLWKDAIQLMQSVSEKIRPHVKMKLFENLKL